jgi:hypothetical protein
MTTETTIEKTRIPGVLDKALVKAASLANTNSRISWSLNDDGQKITQLYFPDSGREITGTNNTWLIAELIDRNELLEKTIEALQAKLKDLTNAE